MAYVIRKIQSLPVQSDSIFHAKPVGTTQVEWKTASLQELLTLLQDSGYDFGGPSAEAFVKGPEWQQYDNHKTFMVVEISLGGLQTEWKGWDTGLRAVSTHLRINRVGVDQYRYSYSEEVSYM
jgi:hypothetical protein